MIPFAVKRYQKNQPLRFNVIENNTNTSWETAELASAQTTAVSSGCISAIFIS